jgi:hypothetical protein
MSPRWDVAVYDRDNKLVLVVEIKKKLGASPEWAARLRRNIFAHGSFPNAPYFLMAFPDRFYLWSDPDTLDLNTAPSYAIDPRPILQPYLEPSNLVLDQISGSSLELIVTSWLSRLIHSGASSDELDSTQRWLTDSGLYAAIEQGSLGHEVLV